MDRIIFYAATLIGAWCFSQIFKTFLNFCTTRQFKIKMLFSDGDFPSTHTTTAITAVIAICYEELPILLSEITTETEKSLAMGVLAVVILWAAFIIRDALGIRLRVQELSHTVCKMLTDSKDVEGSPISENLQVFWSTLAGGINLKVGHMPHEVIGGLILGVIFGFGSSFLRYGNYVMFWVDAVCFVCYTIITFIVIGRTRKRMKTIKKK